ncbi:hypothetical protein FDP41_003827 [Naegleria fowleri]|uniref:Uncharacterized protein n=1 Tax=Naegleria fowleri TaxID=5763 RepID=A0A6A5BSK0_NAEFO|nr:uncharacterized protein FDP41_003827 [Naegleria fowleri]KAF0977174.1 hypothetical protein FDP41_003827 [Naegleria fowleri]CAG4711950.1 unnamed protein product [Naegleria fowleri]
MLHSRFIGFFQLSMVAFLLLVVLSYSTFLVHAQYKLFQTFPGLSCSGKSMVQIYTKSSSCQITNCSTGVISNDGDFSGSITCPTNMPFSPKVGEQMILYYDNMKCSGNPSSVTIIALDTCIRAVNMTYGSIMYKGCKSMVTYLDRNCQTEQMTVPGANIDCFSGVSIQCSGSAEFMMRRNTGIVVSMMIVIVMMISYL